MKFVSASTVVLSIKFEQKTLMAAEHKAFWDVRLYEVYLPCRLEIS